MSEDVPGSSSAPRYLAALAAEVEAIHAEIDVATAAFAAASGIRCRSGCGQCCLKPGIDARPIELLPLARSLHARGEADLLHERVMAAPAGACVLFQPSSHDETMGRCGAYGQRPSVCRLFGFAAVSRPSGKSELSACSWHKRLQPAAVLEAQMAIDRGESVVPHFRDYALRLSMLTPGGALGAVLPINEALARALEKTAFEPH